MMKDDKFVIDNIYTFGIYTNGGWDKTTFHIQLTQTMAERYGEYFLTHESENIEVPVSFDIKGQLDEKEAECLAQNLYAQYCEENDYCDEEKVVEDFYDAAYEYIGDSYYCYTWPEDFKQDCIDYYKQHK